MLTINLNYSAGLLLAALSLTACSKHSTPPSPTHPAPPFLSITGFNPNNGPDSTTVTITGTDFNPTAADDSVYFNGKQARVVNATDSTLVAIVPELAGTGNVVVKTNGNNATGSIFTYDTTWRVTEFAGQFVAPQYLSIDVNSILYLTTLGGYGDLYKITPQGDTSTLLSPLPSPEGTTIDASGNIYAVSRQSPQGSSIYMVTQFGTSALVRTDSNDLSGLVIDANGNIYGADLANRSIDKINPQGQVSTFASNIQNPSGLVLDNNGNLYATSTTNTLSQTAGVILKFSPSGSMTTVASGLMLSAQNGITIDPNNNLYVTCYSPEFPASAVVKITPAGVIDTISTSFHIPLGIAVDRTGNLFVVDVNPMGDGIYGTLSKLMWH